MRGRISWGARLLAGAALVMTFGAAMGKEGAAFAHGRLRPLVVATPPSTDTTSTLYMSFVGGPTLPTASFDIGSYSFGITNTVTLGAGGTTTGKAKFDSVQVSRTVDQDTPYFLNYLASGARFPMIAIAVARSGAGDNKYLEYDLKNAYITDMADSGASSNSPQESLTIFFEAGIIQFRTQNTDGSWNAWQQQGWNQVTNTSDTAP